MQPGEGSPSHPTYREDADASPTEARLAKVGARLTQIVARLARTWTAPPDVALCHHRARPRRSCPPRPDAATATPCRRRRTEPMEPPGSTASGRGCPAQPPPSKRVGESPPPPPAAGRGGEGGRKRRRLGFGPLRRPRGASA
jgi:hypothetical protein